MSDYGRQMTIFDMMYPLYKIKKPIRLIELFAGYGSQSFALDYLGANYTSWKICEWNYHSFKAYKEFHHTNDNTNYAKDMTKEELINILLPLNISKDWNKPMTENELNRLSLNQLKEIYNNIKITHNLVDISKAKGKDFEIENEENRENEYIMTYSFPCTDLSLAGTKSGMSKGSNTRSSLLWQVERILKELTELKQRPDILLMENVPQVHGENNKDDFYEWIKSLENMGYTSYYQDLIATDYGIPQTRNRCFMISFLGQYNYHFPLAKPLTLKLKDFLEDEVDDKYFLTKKMYDYLTNEEIKNYNRKEVFERNFSNDGIASTISTKAGSRATDNFILNNKAVRETLEKNADDIHENTFIDGYNRAVKQNLSATLTAGYYKRNQEFVCVKQNELLCENLIKDNKVKEGDIVQHSRITHPTRYGNNNNNIPCITTRPDTLGITIKVNNATKQGYLEAKEGDGIDISNRMQYHRGTVQVDKSQTLKTQDDVGVCVLQNNRLNIRKLTPRECFRLMGVKDKDFDKVKNKFQDSILYHLAGDSIVVNVLETIFKELVC